MVGRALSQPVPTRPAAVGGAPARAAEAALFVAGYLFYWGAFIPSLRFARGDVFVPGEFDPVSTIVQGGIIAAVALVLVLRFRSVVPHMRASIPFAILLGLAVLSVAWSAFPDVTIRRSIALGGVLLFGLFAVSILGMRRIITWIAIATVIASLASLFVFFLWPAVGRDFAIYGGTMRGVFAQKNALAGSMLPGVACFLFLLLRGRVAVGLAGLLLLLATIILAGSMSALSIAILMSAVTILLALRPFRGPLVVVSLLYLFAAFAAVVLFAFFPADIVELVGRDLTLTGRIGLWQLVLGFAAEQPLLGSGYAAFWNAASSQTQYIHAFLRWDAPDAHNGYLDALAQLGLAGLAVVAGILVATVYRIVAAAPRWREGTLAWTILIVIWILLANLTESRLIEPGGAMLLLYVCWLATASDRLAARKARPAFAVQPFGLRRAMSKGPTGRWTARPT